MNDRNLYISVTRDGQKVSLPMMLCTKAEITDYFSGLSHGDLLSWVFLLAGYACGSSARIDELERERVITNL